MLLKKILLTSVILLITVFISCGCGGTSIGTTLMTINEDQPQTDIPSDGEIALSSYGTCEDALSDGNYTYVAGKSGGVIVVNTSNPEEPKYVTTYNTDGEAWDLYKEGNYLYVADKNGGLVILNVSNPENPSLAGKDSMSGYHIDSVYKSGNYVYTVGGDGGNGYMMITDVTNPASPNHVSTANLFGGNSGSSVWVEGNVAYVGDARGNFYTVNITTKTNPIVSGTLATTDTNACGYGIFKSGNYIYLANGSEGLCVIDVSNPLIPGLAGKATFTNTAYDCAVDGNYAYLACGWGGLIKIDISSPNNPTPLSVLSDPNEASMHSVSLNGTYSYLADNGRQMLVAVSYK